MTQRRLVSISVGRAAMHAALTAFIFAYPCIALMRFFQLFDPQHHGQSHGDVQTWWLFGIVFPIMWTVVWTFLAVCFCVAYNVAARLLGGVRYTVLDSGHETASTAAEFVRWK